MWMYQIYCEIVMIITGVKTYKVMKEIMKDIDFNSPAAINNLQEAAENWVKAH